MSVPITVDQVVSKEAGQPFLHLSYVDHNIGREVSALEYFPNPGQLPFHMGGAPQGGDIRFRLLCGGTGSGKSLAGIVEDCMWCLQFPGVVGYIFEPTYKMIDRIVVPTLNLILGNPFWESPVIAEFNRGRMNIRWLNGSTLWLVSLDDPEQAEGGNIDFAHADEARLVKPGARWETAWRVIQRRLRGSGGGHPIGAWVTTTPNAPGSALYNFFENPKTRSPESKLYRLRLDDNVEHLPEGFIAGIKREHTGSLYQRFVEGLFAGDEAMTFAFDYSVHVQKFEEQFSRMKMGYPPESVGEREKRGKRGFFGDVMYGADFGWTEESAIVAVMFDGDRRAYVLDEVYQNHLSNADIADKCKEMEGKWGKGAFWCDPSSPDTIDFLRKEGLNAKKGNNRRAEGIREVGGRLKDAGDGRHRLYVFEGCINTIDELQSYNEERKGHDHICFIAGTLIETIRGQKPIEEIQIGDYVKTRTGYHKVVASSITNPMAHVYEVSFSNGNTLVGTKDHPIWVKNLGFIKMDALRYGYMVETSDSVYDEAWQKKSFFKERFTDDILNQKIGVTDYIIDQVGGVKLQNLSIEKYGKAFTEKSQRDTTFITKMEIQPIISLKTLNSSLSVYISQNIWNNNTKTNAIEKNKQNILDESDPWHQNGIVQKRDAHGIENTERKSGKTGNQLRKHARTARNNMNLLPTIHDSVLTTVNPHGAVNQELIMLNRYANIAGKPFSQTNTMVQKHAVTVVDRNYLGREPVYNIAVEGMHEYFANGILVSNCDALRYCLMGGKRKQEPAWGFGSRDEVRWPR